MESEHARLKASEQELIGRMATLEMDFKARLKESEAIALHSKNRDQNSDQKLSKYLKNSLTVPSLTDSFEHLSVYIRLQKDLLQKENELKAAKKELMISHRRLEEESDKVTDSQLKASKLNSK